ncbi:unnamed protein product, partial [Cyprideis torosa]
MDEIEAIKNGINPTETLFVVDSMTGQDAVNTAKAFNERIDYDGVVLTKLDGDTRGGAALTVKYTVGKPIKFVSAGEKMDTLDIFHPERMAQRILGMGDIVSFVEKAQEQFDEKEAKRLEKKIRKNLPKASLTLVDADNSQTRIGDVMVTYLPTRRKVDPIYDAFLLDNGKESVFLATHGYQFDDQSKRAIEEASPCELLVTPFNRYELPFFLGGTVSPGLDG